MCRRGRRSWARAPRAFRCCARRRARAGCRGQARQTRPGRPLRRSRARARTRLAESGACPGARGWRLAGVVVGVVPSLPPSGFYASRGAPFRILRVGAFRGIKNERLKLLFITAVPTQSAPTATGNMRGKADDSKSCKNKGF
jgi:hypothetical protein